MFEAMRSGQLEGALLSRAGLAAQQLGVFDTVNAAMFAALWAADDDIASEAGRSRFLEKHNLPVSLFELSSDPPNVCQDMTMKRSSGASSVLRSSSSMARCSSETTAFRSSRRG